MLPRSAYLSDRQFVQAPFLLNPADFPLGAADRQFWPLTRKASLRVWHHYNNLHPPRHMGEGLMLGGPKIPLDIPYVPNSPSAGEMQYLRQRLNLDLHHHCIVFYSMEKAMEMEWGFFLQQGGFHANELLVVNFVDDPRVLISDYRDVWFLEDRIQVFCPYAFGHEDWDGIPLIPEEQPIAEYLAKSDPPILHQKRWKDAVKWGFFTHEGQITRLRIPDSVIITPIFGILTQLKQLNRQCLSEAVHQLSVEDRYVLFQYLVTFRFFSYEITDRKITGVSLYFPRTSRYHDEYEIVPPWSLWERLPPLTDVEELRFTESDLEELPAFIWRCPKLQTLDLRQNRLSTLPPQFANLTQLKDLNLNRNKFTLVPPSILALFQLERLDFSYNQLETVPPELGRLSHLRDLSLGHNCLTKLPETIGQLQALQSLALYTNQFQGLPASLKNLILLKYLSCGWNPFDPLPAVIGKLIGLERLDCEYMNLREVPDVIRNLVRLKRLYLNYNQITEIPLFLTQLPTLEVLELNDNPIVSIPEELLHRPNFRISYNH